MNQNYIMLRKKMLEEGRNQQEVAYYLGSTQSAISNRFNFVYPWTAHEMHLLANWLHIPTERVYDYFILPYEEHLHRTGATPSCRSFPAKQGARI